MIHPSPPRCGPRLPRTVSAESATIIDLYDSTAVRAALQHLVERSVADRPELFEQLFGSTRRPVLVHLATWWHRF